MGKTYKSNYLLYRDRQHGKVYVKFFWWPLVIGILLSIILTIALNILM